MKIDPPGSRLPNQEEASSNPARLVHDLRNLVAPISNAAQILKMRSGGDSNLQSLAELINRQVDAICRLLDGTPPCADSSVDAAAQVGQLQSPQIEEEYRATLKRVLIVDDNSALRASLSAILEEMGFEVKDVANGGEALTIASNWLPSFVFLDVNMPDMNGFQVATALRTRFPSSKMKLVLMSGESLNETLIKKAERAGFNHCLDKVSDLNALHHILQ